MVTHNLYCNSNRVIRNGNLHCVSQNTHGAIFSMHIVRSSQNTCYYIHTLLSIYGNDIKFVDVLLAYTCVTFGLSHGYYDEVVLLTVTLA